MTLLPMTSILGLLEFGDYAIIAWIVVVFAGGAAYTARQRINLGRLEGQSDWLHRKIDALLRQQNPGVGLAEAKAKIEEFLQSK